MKKLISFVLTAALFVSAFVLPVQANNTAAQPDDQRFYDTFFNWLYPNLAELKERYPNFDPHPYYKELYYHYTDGALDWALVEADKGVASTAIIQDVILERAFANNEINYPFNYGYGVYDATTQTFIGLESITDSDQYPGLLALLEQMHIGETITPTVYGENLLYKEQFLAKAKKELGTRSGYPREKLIRYYDELYYHRTNGEIDWVLVHADYFFRLPHGAYYTAIGRHVFRADRGIAQPFGTTYGVYLVAKNQFYKLDDSLVNPNTGISKSFPGLLNAVDELFIGEVIGDINGDKKININDATEMQYCLAEAHAFPQSDGVEAAGYKGDGNPNNTVKYMSDVDRNGKRDINDVTAIQKIIAKVQ